MITYLEKYNELPDNVKDGVSTPEITTAIEELEKEYEVTLATVVMRVLVKDMSLVDLPKFFAFEYDMDVRKAEKLVEAIQTRIFKNVGAHLGISIDPVKSLRDHGAGPVKSLGDLGVSPIIRKTEKTKKGPTVETSHGASPPIRSSNFFFSSEDEEEVKELTKKLKIEEVETEATKQESEKEIKLKVDAIIDQTKLDFSSEELHQRFRKIILTYTKGVRNKIDTKQTMLKKIDSGGLGLNDMLANKALKIADKIKERDGIKDLGKEKINKKKKEDELNIKPVESLTSFSSKGSLADKKNIETHHDTPLGDVPYDFKELQNKKSEEIKKVDWQEINQRSHGAAPVKSPSSHVTSPVKSPSSHGTGPVKSSSLHGESHGASLSTEEPRPNATEEKELSIDLTVKKEILTKKEKEKKEIEHKQAPIAVKRPQMSVRPQMTDVKKVPKLSGPVDELKDLDLLNFRRLSNDPAKAVIKIKEKLKFLEEDSYEKRLQGIKAWRVSMVNKAYLSIGQISIAENKEVQEVIEEQQKSNKNALSYGEFLAIMDLNRSIRF